MKAKLYWHLMRLKLNTRIIGIPMIFPRKIKIVEVGPRDGLQNEPKTLSTSTKIEFINRLTETGLSIIEAGSFVSPKWVPQMADSGEVFQGITRKPHIHYPVLVPNLQGLQAAIAAGAHEIAVFTAASETFSQKNTNCSVNESLARINAIIAMARQHNLMIRGYISCVLGCPYEGQIAVDKVAAIATELFKQGCYEISLGDTIGTGTPHKAQQLIKIVSKTIPLEHIAIHFHDTYGQALANIYACIEQGISIIDSSIAGLGGCPYAKGASGNVATEDVIYMLEGLNINTGVDLNKLIAVDKFICQILKRPSRSKVALAKWGA